MKQLFCLFFLVGSIRSIAQQEVAKKGRAFTIYSQYSMFPDSLRNAMPRIYNGKTYTAAEHYNDSSAFIFVPDYFDKSKPFHVVCWFHGWNNCIDSALVQYRLIEQFYAAHLNAIFILPEGPKNSPDSYAGKFERPAIFNAFIQEVRNNLIQQKLLLPTNQSFDLIYAGHSGAYHAIANLLLNASYPCKGVLLFDALYAEPEKFAMYVQMHPLCKLINIYTDNGGTFQNSKNFITEMAAWRWKYTDREEIDFMKTDVRNNQAVFLHSKMQHNDVVANLNNFQRFLEALE